MLFRNPAGAPEMACDECGCRWFDRQTNTCYECAAPVSAESLREFDAALAAFAAARESPAPTPAVRVAGSSPQAAPLGSGDARAESIATPPRVPRSAEAAKGPE